MIYEVGKNKNNVLIHKFLYSFFYTVSLIFAFCEIMDHFTSLHPEQFFVFFFKKVKPLEDFRVDLTFSGTTNN